MTLAPPTLGRVSIYAPSYVPFHPEAHLTGHCGGSEEAVIHVAPRLRALGWDVTVYASMGDNDAFATDPRARLHIKDGVLWRPVEEFDPDADRDALVLWRATYALTQPVFQRAPGAKVLWLHDAVLHGNPATIREHADAVMVVSESHKRTMEGLLGKDAPYVVIQNGIDPAAFPPPDESQRVPTRAVYFSSPDRGLEVLLDLWPQVRAEVPEATLDVFYGFGSARRMAAANVEHRHELRAMEARVTGRLEALASSGVTMRGGVSHPELHAFLRTCGVWAYPHGPERSPVETFCIASAKALACGVWPVTTDNGALPDVCFAGTTVPTESLATPEGRDGYARRVAWAMKCRPEQGGPTALLVDGTLPPAARAILHREALRRYDWQIGARQISDVLSECIAEREAAA